MSNPTTASAAFESSFSRLMALVQQRVELEWQFHQRNDLRPLQSDLLELIQEFGALLRVVYRYDLNQALMQEAVWYASALASRGPGKEAFSLLLESWIIAIQGLIKPPECNILAGPVQELRTNLSTLINEAEKMRSVPAAANIQMLVEKVIVGDLWGAQKLLSAQLASKMPPHELITHTILPAMAEIGRRWERNDLAIYEEHLATETMIRLLAGLSASVPKIEHNKLSALVSCVPNDKHQLLPMALSEYLELRGWRVCSLGSSLPAEQIALAASTLKPNAIFLSLNMLSRLSDALDVLEKLHKSNSHCPIFIGGHGTFAGRLLLEEAQASVTQDFDEAHRLALIGGTTYA